jgi:hypothetical protein
MKPPVEIPILVAKMVKTYAILDKAAYKRSLNLRNDLGLTDHDISALASDLSDYLDKDIPDGEEGKWKTIGDVIDSVTKL